MTFHITPNTCQLLVQFDIDISTRFKVSLFTVYLRRDQSRNIHKCPPWGHLTRDVPVEDVLDRDVLGGDITSAQGCPQWGRPRRGHLCPFLLLHLRTYLILVWEVFWMGLFMNVTIVLSQYKS